jgi:hypothetical protein
LDPPVGGLVVAVTIAAIKSGDALHSLPVDATVYLLLLTLGRCESWTNQCHCVPGPVHQSSRHAAPTSNGQFNKALVRPFHRTENPKPPILIATILSFRRRVSLACALPIILKHIHCRSGANSCAFCLLFAASHQPISARAGLCIGVHNPPSPATTPVQASRSIYESCATGLSYTMLAVLPP